MKNIVDVDVLNEHTYNVHPSRSPLQINLGNSSHNCMGGNHRKNLFLTENFGHFSEGI